MKTNILVAGGGPAGLSAAIAAARHGAGVMLIDEGPAPGGQLTYRLADGAREAGAKLTAEAREAGVGTESNAVVWGLFGENEAAVSKSGASTRVAFDRAILATGSTDRVVSFAGGSLPGVFTTRALQILMHRHRVLPGSRVAVIGDAGDEVSGDIEMSGGTVIVRDPGRELDRLVASGDGGVEQLTVGTKIFEIDLIVLAFGKVPDPRLAIMAECTVMLGDGPGSYIPVVDERLGTTNPAIFAAGEIIGAATVAESIAQGRLAGIAAAASLGLATEEAIERARIQCADARGDRGVASASVTFTQFAGQGEWL